MIRLYRFLFFVLAVSVLACGTGSPQRKLNLYPTETLAVTQTPIFVQITTTPADTATARVVVVSETPASNELCVTAQEAVHLRPSPSSDNYPIVALKSGEKVVDLGGRNGKWWFVKIGDRQGWIHSDYVGEC